MADDNKATEKIVSKGKCLIGNSTDKAITVRTYDDDDDTFEKAVGTALIQPGKHAEVSVKTTNFWVAWEEGQSVDDFDSDIPTKELVEGKNQYVVNRLS